MSIGVWAVYLIKVTTFQWLFYLFGKLLLRRDTLHHYNRILWLGLIALSFLLPLLEVSRGGGEPPLRLDSLLTLDHSTPPTHEGVLSLPWYSSMEFWVTLFVALYLVGVVAWGVYYLVVYLRLVRFVTQLPDSHSDPRYATLFRSCEEQLGVKQRVKYIVLDQEVSPFSWMRTLVITRQELQEGGREVLLHELAHIHYRHSWDILLLNLVTTIQWYNPAAWLAKGELQQLHEYCADNGVIDAGVNAKEYQLLLIKKSVGHRLYSTSNNFNHSNLKKRITMMMMRKKSNKWSAAKSLVALPVSLLAVSLFAHPLVANGLTEISEVKVMENSPEIKTESPISRTENSDKSASSQKGKVIYIVNDKVMDTEIAKSIAPEKIASITVVKNGALNETYGLPDNKGVILIELKKGEEVASTVTPPADGQKTVAIYKTESPISMAENSDKSANSQKGKVIYIVNDKVMDIEMAKSIASEKIASITVVKNGALNETYGLPDNKGVILIELKKGEEVASTVTSPADGQKPAAVYLKVLRDSADVSPDQIESIHVYKKVSKSTANHFGVVEGEDVIEIVPRKK